MASAQPLRAQLHPAYCIYGESARQGSPPNAWISRIISACTEGHISFTDFIKRDAGQLLVVACIYVSASVLRLQVTLPFAGQLFALTINTNRQYGILYKRHPNLAKNTRNIITFQTNP